MRLGSGDIKKLLQSRTSKGFKDLLVRFIMDEPQHRDALKSPIHACRAGAILEEVMYLNLPNMYLFQVRVISKELDVMSSTLDFSLMDKGQVTYFIEMKTLNFREFLKLWGSDDKLEYVKKHFKSYYNQVQGQLFVTGLKTCTLRFVSVYDDTNDSDNWNRKFEDNEILDIKISYDNDVVEQIKERASIFQSIKNYMICQ